MCIKPLAAAIAVLLITNTAAANPASEASAVSAVSADTAQTARIRLFGRNGAGIKLFPGESCSHGMWSNEGIKVSGGMGDAFVSFIGASSNESIGIPETSTTKNMKEQDGILAKFYFREYAIPAEKPSTVFVSMRSTRTVCGGLILFTPQAGNDYEMAFRNVKNGCELGINQLVTVDGVTELVPVPVSKAQDCN